MHSHQFLLCLSLGCIYIDPESGMRVIQMFVTLIQWCTDGLLPYHFTHLVYFSQVWLVINQDVWVVILVVKTVISQNGRGGGSVKYNHTKILSFGGWVILLSVILNKAYNRNILIIYSSYLLWKPNFVYVRVAFESWSVFEYIHPLCKIIRLSFIFIFM